MAEDPLETVEYTVSDGVLTLALNRPEKYNAINQQMHNDLATSLHRARRDRSLRAVILTGNGRGFCAGQDVGEFAVARASDEFRVDEHVRATYNRLVLSLRALELPVIAAVNGVAAGAGWSLALAADLRFAGTSATFTQGFTRLGLVPDTGATWLLPDLVGTSRALQLAWGNDVINADQALAWGLVNFVVDDDEVREAATNYARRLAALPPRALGLTKRAIYRSTSTSLADALEYEAQLQHFAAATEDHLEGVMAFIERREPVFTGA
ncbi:MAG: Phenylacetate degradation, enoyl-CoA hydratase paaB [Thermoleophilia bacterium]|nr:Phenylacetate degradation, enoyl-CoA hydratase paaB [Thermoleophilia bacterium]